MEITFNGRSYPKIIFLYNLCEGSRKTSLSIVADLMLLMDKKGAYIGELIPDEIFICQLYHRLIITYFLC